MAGGALATPVYRAKCTLGYAGCRRSLFHHHCYMYYQKTILVGKNPDQTLLHSSIQLQGRTVINNIGAFGNILIS